MRHFQHLVHGALLGAMLCSFASAATLLDITGALSAMDPTQLGRLSRNGVASDWSSPEAFPGVINTTTAYHYETFVLNVGVAQYIQISLDDPNTNLFASAYVTSYLPDSAGSPNFGFDTHYVGDAGSSGNAFPGDPEFFQVVIPVNGTLVVVINEATPNAGIGETFNLLVEGFIDTEFTDPPASTVPEPASIVLSGGGFGGLALIGFLRRKRRQA